VHEIRKYKFYDIACSDVLFVVHRYHYKFVGLAGSGIDPATVTYFRSTDHNQKICPKKPSHFKVEYTVHIHVYEAYKAYFTPLPVKV